MNTRTPDVITVAVTRVDGGLTVVRIVTTEYRPTTAEERAGGAGARIANWTIDPTDAYVESILAKHAWTGDLSVVSWRRVPNAFVDETTDHTFRNAWKDTPGRDVPDHDLPKARALHRDRLRQLRAPLLDALDADYLRADEANDGQEKQRIRVRKQQLRDVTADPAIDAATTVDDLKQAGMGTVTDGH